MYSFYSFLIKVKKMYEQIIKKKIVLFSILQNMGFPSNTHTLHLVKLKYNLNKLEN